MYGQFILSFARQTVLSFLPSTVTLCSLQTELTYYNIVPCPPYVVGTYPCMSDSAYSTLTDSLCVLVLGMG